MQKSGDDLAKKFQSTLPVGGATWPWQQGERPKAISIHAPRGGSDMPDSDGLPETWMISIHAPRGGSDSAPGFRQRPGRHFNPRSPWGERQFQFVIDELLHLISIHAPRGGSDVSQGIQRPVYGYFNPRSPWRERRCSCFLQLELPQYFNPRSPWGERRCGNSFWSQNWIISIHAPRGGSDRADQA